MAYVLLGAISIAMMRGRAQAAFVQEETRLPSSTATRLQPSMRHTSEPGRLEDGGRRGERTASKVDQIVDQIIVDQINEKLVGLSFLNNAVNRNLGHSFPPCNL
jgi:hypothetical protein